ncbi:MAG: peptidyl-prolyl cis-trans isomerase [Candidatus Krumholzibacteria bacterium]|nr:peptidyl-prolyl cis-trans isomerase [Candidatus Krumholzibacteria bacterium]
MFKRGVWIGVTLVFFMALIPCCSKNGKSLKVKTGIAARVKDTKITLKEMEKRYGQLDEKLRGKFEGLKGKADFVDKMIEEQVVYDEAIAKGLDNDIDVKAAIEEAKKSILLKEYFSKVIMGKVKVEEKEINDYYENNKEEFRTNSLVRAQHIMTKDSLKAVRIKKALDEGTRFGILARDESEDRDTANSGGNLGYFNPGGYIKSIGYSSRFSRAVERLEVGEISDVVQHERGYSIIKLNEKNPSIIRPYSEVKQHIQSMLLQGEANKVFSEEIEKLKKKYKTENYLREKIASSTRSPEELWEMAQMEDDSMERINYYLELVNLYPEHEYAPQALFMVGFVYAEEERDLVEARRAFDRLVGSYPGSEVVESAKWMIGNLSEPHPKFESIESMKDKMMEEERAEREGKE